MKKAKLREVLKTREKVEKAKQKSKQKKNTKSTEEGK